MANIFEINRPDNKITLGTTGTTINIASHTASTILGLDASKDLESLAIPLIVTNGGTGAATLTDGGILLGSGTGAITALGVASNGQIPIGDNSTDPVLATITGTTDHISVANGSGSITLDLDTNTKTLLGSFNGIFLEKLDFTISYSDPTVTGSLEKDGGGDLTQRFSDGYTILDCDPTPLTINLTTYVGTDAVPKEVFVYILQSAKTVMAASNSDWPTTEHIKIANLLLKSAATTGSDGGALANRNWNDFASAANGEGHITHIERRLRQEPSQWDSGVALTLKNSAGAALTTGNSSTAVEIVTTEGKVYQLHRHTFPAFDMYTVGTDDAHIVNQPTDSGGAYVTTADLVSDITRYVDGSASGLAIGNNKYFNLVIWGVQNRSGEPSHIMINLPTGRYTTEANATADVDGTSVFDIPALFKGMGFLIARLTFKLATSGPEWTYIAQEDLRGQIPPISAGVSVTTTDHALLANLTFATAGHTGFQAQGDVLDDLNTLGAVGANSEFLVGTGAGTLAWENAATAATSMGLGTGDNPQLAGLGLGVAATAGTMVVRSSGADGEDIFVVERSTSDLLVFNYLDNAGTDSCALDLKRGGTTLISFSTRSTDDSYFNMAGGLAIGGTSAKTKLTIEGALTLKEQAVADGDTVAYGQFWVRDDAPCIPMFTDDTGSDFQIAFDFGSRTTLDSLGAALVKDEVYKVGSDGIVTVYRAHSGTESIETGYTDGSNPPTTVLRARTTASVTNKQGGFQIHVIKDDYWKITFTNLTPTIYWLPMGSGTCVKQ
jgi:hypothetical protein